LQYCLEKVPNSSMALGNIGQSYFQLGDMTKAAGYFQRCLKIDSLHPEVNHSMGMIYTFNKNFEMARHCFTRELTGCVRKSTLGICKKFKIKISLMDAYKRRKKREGLPEKDFFDELKLSLFTLPTFPENSKAFLRRKQELAELAASAQAEQQFWTNKALKISASYTSASKQDQPGIYTDLVEAMLEELHEEFTPEYLNNYTEKDISAINNLLTLGTQTLNGVYCPPAPAGSGTSVQEAYAVKCCEEKMRPLADGYAAELGGIVRPIFTVGLVRWKTYINKLVNILHLDPSPANAMLLCNTVSAYFTYFNNALLYYNMGDFNNFLANCRENYIPGSADKVIESNRLWNLSCAPWMNVEVEFFSAALKADCNKFAIEGGSALMGAYEHEFKSHQSTLLLGPGMKGDIGGVINGEVKAQFFLTFDENLGFSDLGIKRTLEAGISGTPIPIVGDKIKIGGNLAGIEVSDKIGIMSGHSAEIEWKGMLNQSMEWLNAAK
jgi:tetratricopeptide (TPR) repeat protein